MLGRHKSRSSGRILLRCKPARTGPPMEEATAPDVIRRWSRSIATTVATVPRVWIPHWRHAEGTPKVRRLRRSRSATRSSVHDPASLSRSMRPPARNVGVTIRRCRTRTSPIPPPAAASPITPCRMPTRRRCATRIIEGTLDARLIAVEPEPATPCADFGERRQVEPGRHRRPGPACSRSPRRRPSCAASSSSATRCSTGRSATRRRASSRATMPSPARCAGPGTWEAGRARDAARGPNLYPGHAQHVDDGLRRRAAGLVYLPLGLRGRLLELAAAPTEKNSRPRWSPSMCDRQAGLALPDRAQRRLGLRSGLAGDAGRFPTGGAVPALVLPSKRGDIFVLDRRTGKPLVGVEERPFRKAAVEPEQRAKTQPFSPYHTLRKPDLTERDMWGMSPIDQMICRIQFRRELSGHLHPAHDRTALHRISRLQRRLGLGRHRRRSGARRDRRQLQRHAELQPPGAARGGNDAAGPRAIRPAAARSAASKAPAIRRPARPMPSTSTPDGGCR